MNNCQKGETRKLSEDDEDDSDSPSNEYVLVSYLLMAFTLGTMVGVFFCELFDH